MEIIEKHSPNGGNRPQENTKCIIHAMGEYIKSPDSDVILHASDFLKEVGLSAHLLICPDGAIFQTRRFHERAYHALDHNDKTIGIEFLVEGIHDDSSCKRKIAKPYLTHIQYTNGVKYIKEKIVGELGILHFVRHSDVDPARKVDPAEGFPWIEFLGDIGLIYKYNGGRHEG